MRIPIADLRAQYATIKPEIDAAIARVLERCSFILGPEAEAFEAEFAGYCETEYCIGVSNGTDALRLVLLALGIGAGDEVVTVSHTFIAAAEAIATVGARPVFVDVDPHTLNLDAACLEAALTPCARAVIPAHLYGQPADMDAILAIARAHGLPVIEDAAQAHGARYKGRRAGSLGAAATFSFYPGKNLGAYGDAGAIVTSNADLAMECRRLRDHGRYSKYEHSVVGYNCRLDGLQAAVLRAKLAHLDAWNERRRVLAAAYRDGLGSTPNLRLVQTLPECEPVYHQLVVEVDNRSWVQQTLQEAGIQTGIHYPLPLHLQPAFRYLNVAGGTLPVTEAACARILSLPMYPEMSETQVGEVIGALTAASR